MSSESSNMLPHCNKDKCKIVEHLPRALIAHHTTSEQVNRMSFLEEDAHTNKRMRFSVGGDGCDAPSHHQHQPHDPDHQKNPLITFFQENPHCLGTEPLLTPDAHGPLFSVWDPQYCCAMHNVDRALVCVNRRHENAPFLLDFLKLFGSAAVKSTLEWVRAVQWGSTPLGCKRGCKLARSLTVGGVGDETFSELVHAAPKDKSYRALLQHHGGLFPCDGTVSFFTHGVIFIGVEDDPLSGGECKRFRQFRVGADGGGGGGAVSENKKISVGDVVESDAVFQGSVALNVACHWAQKCRGHVTPTLLVVRVDSQTPMAIPKSRHPSECEVQLLLQGMHVVAVENMHLPFDASNPRSLLAPFANDGCNIWPCKKYRVIVIARSVRG
jgi:hypothetical protein